MSNTPETVNTVEDSDIVNSLKKMSGKREKVEERFESELRNEIERDIEKLCFSHLSKNPKMTPLKQVMTRDYTHYRTEPVISSGVIDGCRVRFTYREWKKYSCFYNLSVQIMVSYSSFEKAVKSTDLEFKFDNQTILLCKGEQFYRTLIINPSIYDELRNTYERTKILNIPLQYIICETTYLSAGDIDVSVSFSNFEFGDKIDQAELSAIGVTVCGDQGRKYMYCSGETLIKSYHFYDEVQNELPIDMQIGIFKVLALPVDDRKYDSTLKVGDAQMIRTDSMFNRVNRYVRDIPNGYFYASREEAGSRDRAYQTHGLCYAHSDTTKVTIDSDETYNVCVMFQNALITMGHNDDEPRTCGFKYSPVVDSHVPQPGTPFFKVSDTECIEGYWAPLNRMYAGDAHNLYNYPITTNEPVDPEFMEKLENVLKSSRSTHYLGISNCRICEEHNGASEYFIEKDGITFRMPEGMTHYYSEHMVQPSPEFREFVMNY
jgi:hypothetical protein